MQEEQYHNEIEKKHRRILTTYRIDGSINETLIGNDEYIVSFEKLPEVIREARGVKDHHLWNIIEFCEDQLEERFKWLPKQVEKVKAEKGLFSAVLTKRYENGVSVKEMATDDSYLVRVNKIPELIGTVDMSDNQLSNIIDSCVDKMQYNEQQMILEEEKEQNTKLPFWKFWQKEAITDIA